MSKKRKNYGFNAEVNTKDEEQKIPATGESQQQNPETTQEEPKKGFFTKVKEGGAAVAGKAIPVAKKVGKAALFVGVVAAAFTLGKKSGGNGSDPDDETSDDEETFEEEPEEDQE